jgi:hypothetical protein
VWDLQLLAYLHQRATGRCGTWQNFEVSPAG